MKPQFEKAILIFRLIMIILIFTGLIIEGDFDIQYWTNQSNIMILIWLIFAVLFQSKSKLTSTVKSGLRGAVTVYILVTFLIYATLLANGPQSSASIILHYLIPLMFLLDWVLTETGAIYLWKFLGYWIIYPLIYLAQVIIIGTLTGFYPYFFVDLPNIGIASFIINVLLLIAFFLLLGSILTVINNIRYH